ncbi:hypothetical protein LN650_24440 [Klebsiella pneumoniae subsp. pneumoniae]|nr:hypothetical protein [Klebsiella pneumoniae subsp. pneumoniae]
MKMSAACLCSLTRRWTALVAANEVIKIDDQPEGASGLGVQILSAGGSLVPLNQVSQVWSGKKAVRRTIVYPIRPAISRRSPQ